MMMLALLKNNRGKYLLLLPVVFLVLNALFFRYATQEIQKALLNERYVEIVNFVDLLAMSVEENSDNQWLDHMDNVRDTVEFLDKMPHVYAGAYHRVDSLYILISERFFATSHFEPFDYSVFQDALYSQERGTIVIHHEYDGELYGDMHLYFRSIPNPSTERELVLVVAGVSTNSITTSVSLWVSAGQWINTGITFVINVWLISIIVRVGISSEERRRKYA
jgi:hypothetical protein